MPTSLKRSIASTPMLVPAFERIAKRIGAKLRDVYGPPEHEPLPIEHVELLLRLRHKERDAGRRSAPAD